MARLPAESRSACSGGGGRTETSVRRESPIARHSHASHDSRLRTLWFSIITLAILGQTAFFVRNYSMSWGWRVKRVWNEPRSIRTADLDSGAQGARIGRFGNEVVPGESNLIPPQERETIEGGKGRAIWDAALRVSILTIGDTRVTASCQSGRLPAELG